MAVCCGPGHWQRAGPAKLPHKLDRPPHRPEQPTTSNDHLGGKLANIPRRTLH